MWVFIRWIASLNYIIKTKNAPLIFKNNSKYISFLIHDSAFNFCPGPHFSNRLTVFHYADYTNGAKLLELREGDIGQMSNVKINEFLISCCKKKNYFLISAQPSKNLRSSSNKIQWNCGGCRERQKAGQTDSHSSKWGSCSQFCGSSIS